MRKLTLLFFSAALISCEQVEKLDAQLYDSTEANVPITKLDQLEEIDQMESVADKEGAGKLILKAWGGEPGWIAEFYNNRVKMILDYGADSLTLYDNVFENVNDEKGFSYHHNTSNQKKIDLSIKVENLNCTDASGETRSRKVSVSYNGKNYKGCGMPVK